MRLPEASAFCEESPPSLCKKYNPARQQLSIQEPRMEQFKGIVELQAKLSQLASTFTQVQFPLIVTTDGVLVCALTDKTQSTDEFISHALSVLRLSDELIKLLKLRCLQSLKVRGVGEMVLCLYLLSDEVVLLFYTLKPSNHYTLYDANSLDIEVQPFIQNMQTLLFDER
jgi:predicted regulator of Ras-like GTPase activity (Roadblock/LC7/MglB family)